MPSGGLDRYAAEVVERVFGAAPEGAPARARINGIPAVVHRFALRTGEGPVEAVVAAFAGADGGAYHFVLVSPPGAPIPGAVDALVGSFRHLSPQEAARLRPRVIDVVTVGAGDTVQSLAARMASDRPRERFLMINDRAADAPIRPGERVKIIRFADAR